MSFKKHNPGCPCCECGPVCITVCKGSTVVLKFPDNSTQTKTADGLEDRQEICFDITGAGAYRATVTHSRLVGFIHNFTADCSHQTIPYTPTPAPGYRAFPCGGCCLPVKETLNYADGTNSVTLTFSETDPVWGVPGWGGCAPLQFNPAAEGEICTATADCGDVGPDCNGGFGNCQENCSDLIPVPGYFFLSAECEGSIIAMKCVAVGAPGGPFNNCWLTGPGDDCGTMSPLVDDHGFNESARHTVGLFAFKDGFYPVTLPQPSVACPTAFLAYDPNGGCVNGDTGCFATFGGVVLTET